MKTTNFAPTLTVSAIAFCLATAGHPAQVPFSAKAISLIQAKQDSADGNT